jgi:hypothetical protein
MPGPNIGFEIHDGQQVPIIKVETTQQDVPNAAPMLVTRINGIFHNSKGKRVAWTEGDGNLQCQGPFAYGFTSQGSWAMRIVLTDDQIDMATWTALTHGAVSEVVTGHRKKDTINMDGKLFKNATLEDCDLHIATGEFGAIGSLVINGCRFHPEGVAARIHSVLRNVRAQ